MPHPTGPAGDACARPRVLEPLAPGAEAASLPTQRQLTGRLRTALLKKLADPKIARTRNLGARQPADTNAATDAIRAAYSPDLLDMPGTSKNTAASPSGAAGTPGAPPRSTARKVRLASTDAVTVSRSGVRPTLLHVTDPMHVATP